MTEERHYFCTFCEEYQKTTTDGRRELCEECGMQANASRFVNRGP